jgi:AcrR family transcriptional regulator
MPRHADERIRDKLLSSVVDYVLGAGLAELSLRPLAAAIETSPRTILYHFGSKDELVVAVMEEARRRQRVLLETWYERSAEHDPRTLLLRAWQWLAAPRHERILRLFFEAYGLGLADRKRYAAVLRGGVNDWIDPFTRTFGEQGFTRERSAALATLLVAVLRGLLLDLLATGERARVDRAFRSFINAIEFP